MCGGADAVATLRTWWLLGALATWVQVVSCAFAAAVALSPTIIVCAVLAVLFAVLYTRSALRVRALTANAAADGEALGSELSHTHVKPFLLFHVVLATWYVWMTLITYVVHINGVNVLDILTRSVPTGSAAFGLEPRERALAVALLALTLASIAGNVWMLVMHGRRVADGDHRGYTTPSAPRVASLCVCAVDCALLALTALVCSATHDNALWLLFAYQLVAGLAMLHHAYSCWSGGADVLSDVLWHVRAQMLSMQGMLVSSTVFLVNIFLLSLLAMGTDMPTLFAQGSTAARAQIVTTFVVYAAMVGACVVLVNLHTRMEMPAYTQIVAQRPREERGIFTVSLAREHSRMLDAGVTVVPLT